jgi:acyl dehydratase
VATGHNGDGRITEKMVEDLQARLNKPVPGKAWTSIANRDSIRHAALAVGDDNPLYMDEGYARDSRFKGLIAPPLFPYAAVSASAAVGGVGFPGIFALHAIDDWTFLKPVRDGDSLSSSLALVGLEKRDSVSPDDGIPFHQPER